MTKRASLMKAQQQSDLRSLGIFFQVPKGQIPPLLGQGSLQNSNLPLPNAGRKFTH